MPSTMTTKGADKKTVATEGVMNTGAVTDKKDTYEKSAESKKNGQFQRRIDKSKIPTCKILGVDIAAIDMNWLLKYTNKNFEKLKGDCDYMCVVNVYSDVTAYNDPEFCKILNSSVLCVFCQEEIPKIGKKIPYFRKGKSLLSEKDNPVLLKRASPLHSALVKWLFAA